MYLLAVVALWLLVISIFVPFWPLELYVSFLIYICGSSIVIIAIEIWRRKQIMPSLMFALLPLAISLVLPLDLAVHSRDHREDPDEITIITHNMRYSTDNARQVALQARQNSADIIGLQETQASQIDTISEILDYEEVYVSECDCSVNGDTVALISRYPIIESETVEVDVRGGQLIDVVLNVDETPMRVIVTHLPVPVLPRTYDVRERGFERITEHAQSRQLQPEVIMGDFNTTPWSTSLRNFSNDNKYVRNTIAEGSARASWCGGPFELGCLRIDHMFIDTDLGLLSSRIGQAAGSDHRPIITRVAR